jgi:hypothetical protein
VDQDPGLVTRIAQSGDTLLHSACIGYRLDLARTLLDRGSAVNAIKANGFDALMFACTGDNDRLALVTLLLDRGASVLTTGVDELTALIIAAVWCHLDVCLLLVTRGANLLATYDGRTALDPINNSPNLSDQAKAEHVAALRLAFANGPHASQVQRRKDENWARRWPLMLVLAGHDFLPTAARRLALAALAPALPTHVAIPPLPSRTRAQRRALFFAKVFAHRDLAQRVVGFL